MTQTLTIDPMTPCLGAEISGIDVASCGDTDERSSNQKVEVRKSSIPLADTENARQARNKLTIKMALNFTRILA